MPLVLFAISVLPLLIMFVCRHPMLVLCAFPVAQVVGVLARGYAFNAGGFDFLPMDPAIFFAIAYLGIFVLRYPRKVARVLRENIFLTVFLALVALYVVIYTPIYGQSAIGEARKFYGFFVVPLLALIVIKKPEDLRRFFQVVILTAAFVAILALRLAQMQGSIVKVVDSEASLIMALAAFAMLIHRFHGVVVFNPLVDRVLLFLFAGLAIGCGHRTVWLAIGFGLALVFWLYFARPAVVIKCAAVLLMLVMAGGSALVYFPAFAGNLGERFAGIIDPYTDETASWRIEGWRYQLEQLQNSGSLLFGEGIGDYYSWEFSSGSTITASPHNAYVQIILKFGLFGFTMYVLLAVQFFRKTLAVRRMLRPGPIRAYMETGILTFGAAQGYILGYAFEPSMLIFFAVAISGAKLTREMLPRFQESRTRGVREKLHDFRTQALRTRRDSRSVFS